MNWSGEAWNPVYLKFKYQMNISFEGPLYHFSTFCISDNYFKFEHEHNMVSRPWPWKRLQKADYDILFFRELSSERLQLKKIFQC